MVSQRLGNHGRIPWEDRFNEPSLKDLRQGLPDPFADLFDAACRELEAICGGRRHIVWHGSCWKWTLGFSARRRKPLAVVIPNPQDFQIAMRVEPGFVASVWDRRMKRAVRDGLGLAADPFDTDWGVWTITSQAMLRDVIKLIRDNVAYLDDER